jgi:hypothetical protein
MERERMTQVVLGQERQDKRINNDGKQPLFCTNRLREAVLTRVVGPEAS